MKESADKLMWNRFTLREALCLSFCATFIIIAKAVLRLHLHITGHSMVFTMFFLILGRGCVQRLGAATFTGMIAGILSLVLGMGAKSGPLVILKFLLPGVFIDCAAAVYPMLAYRYTACIIAGALAAGSRAFIIGLVESLAGMESVLILQNMILASIMNMIFGGIGGAMVPTVVRRLVANRLIPSAGRDEIRMKDQGA